MIHETTAAIWTVTGTIGGFIAGGGIAWSHWKKQMHTQTEFRNIRIMKPSQEVNRETMTKIIAAKLKDKGEVTVGVDKTKLTRFVKTLSSIIKEPVEKIDVQQIPNWKDKYVLTLKR